jgi:Ca2+-binding EF-hand superfamily protein
MARWLVVFSLLVVLGLAFYPARADDDTKKKVNDLLTYFKKLDANRDGRVSKDEFLKLADRFKDRVKARQKLATVYDEIDTNKKGITQDQFKQYLETHPKKRTP